jgi:hypothetical protein
MKSPLLFADTIVPKRRGNDKLRATPDGKLAFFLNRLKEAMHDECINLAELSVPENLWECSHNTKPMLLP